VFSQQGWISAVVLAGGYVVGVWKYQVKQAQLAVTVEPFAPLSRAIRDGIVLVADHNAYHIGEFAIMRQVMGTWGNAPH